MDRRAVVVDARDFATGQLPPVCVISGQPADLTMTVTATRGVPLWLLLLGGWIVFLIAAAMSSKVDGEVPIVVAEYERCRGHLRRWQQAWIGGGVVGLAAAIVAVTAEGPTEPAAVAVLIAAVTVVLLRLPDRAAARPLFIRPRLRRDVTWIDLRAVHPSFALAVERGDHDQARADR